MSKSPKYVIRHVLKEAYLAVTKNGWSWHDQPRHCTKWESQYQTKLFIESNGLFYCVPELFLPKQID